MVYLLECLGLRQKLGNPDDIGDTYAHLSRLYAAQGDYEKAIDYNEQINVIFQQTGNLNLIGNYNANQIIIQMAMKNNLVGIIISYQI